MSGFLAIVPARAGSKGVPGKNRAQIGGRLVIDYTVDLLASLPECKLIAVTTDDQFILKHYANYGKSNLVLIERPAELATDLSSTSAVVAHTLSVLEKSGELLENVLLAQPTTPLRNEADVRESYIQFVKVKSDSLVSVCRAEGIRHPKVMYSIENGVASLLFASMANINQRQHDAAVFQRNGAIYFFRKDFFKKTGRVMSDHPALYEMPFERSINIDGPADMAIAKALILQSKQA